MMTFFGLSTCHMPFKVKVTLRTSRYVNVYHVVCFPPLPFELENAYLVFRICCTFESKGTYNVV